MQTRLPAPAGAGRFEWVDSVRGMAILWIAFFHCFIAYGVGYPWPITLGNYGAFVELCAPVSLLGKISCPLEAAIAGLMQRGAQGVGVFILFSGFGLTYSLFRRKDAAIAWGKWYRHRLFRLFPIYWLAHLIFLISPIQYKPDPIDYRFLLSFLGDRIYPVQEMFFYMNPSWWFFGLLLELYIVFPILVAMLRRLGSAGFLAFCVVFAVASRYVLFAVLEANGNWVQGAFFGCRLWEFGAGMVLGKLLAEKPKETFERLFSTTGIVSGIALYAAGCLSYQPNFFYSLSDGLTGMGLTLILIHIAVWAGKVPGLGKALVTAGIYSYSIYLFHQPFVMYAGDKLRSYQISIFFVLATAIIAAIAMVSICFEYAVNRALDRSKKI